MRHTLLSWMLPLLCVTACARAQAPTTPQLAVTGDFAALPLELVNDPHTGLVAVADLTIDRASGSVAMHPVREAGAIGDTFSEIGLGKAFREMFGRNFEVTGLRSTGATTVEIDFLTTHPFSPAIRPDLAIFNLKAWLVTDQPTIITAGKSAAPGLVTNADGYGRMWTDTAVSQPEFSAAVYQPYVILNEDPSSGVFDWQNPAGFNVFFPGMVSTDTVALDLGTATQLQVRLYLTADYGQSAVRATRQTPDYRLPQFAGNAAWKTQVTELANTLEAGVASSSATFQIDIWDWKHGAGLGSDVAGATIEIPGVTLGPQTLSLSGTGSDPTPLTASVLVTNAAGAVAGDYWGVVYVVDEAVAGQPLDENFAPVPTPDEYSQGQWFRVTLSGPTAAPPDASFTFCNTLPVKSQLEVHFDGTSSTPGTHPITAWEWDFDYVAPTFDVMSTGTLADYGYSATGTFTAALRVSDGFGSSDIATFPIQVVGTPVWTSPTRLTTNAYQEQLCELTESADGLVVDHAGNAHLIFGRVLFSGTFATEYWYAQLPAAGCNTSGAWTAPAMFHTTPNSQQITRKVSLAVTADNTVHALVNQRDGSSRDQVLVLSRPTAGPWSAPVTALLGPNSSNRLTGATLAVDGLDQLGVLAFERTPQPACPGTPANPFNLLFSRRVSGVWSPQQDIADADIVVNIPSCGSTGYIYGHGAALAGLQDGEWVAVWDSTPTPFNGTTDQNGGPTKLNWARTTSGVWGTQSTLYTSAGRYRHPILERAPNGSLWLIAKAGPDINPGANPIGLARYASGSWDADMTTVLPGGLGSIPYFALDFDNDGRGIFTVTYQNSNVPFSAKRFWQTDSLATIAAQPADLVEATLPTFRYPNLVAGLHDGRYVAVWSTLKYGSAFFNDFELDAALWQ